MTAPAARGFPAFARRRSGGARTWLGRALVAALEDTAVDTGLLRAARAVAAGGRIGPVSVAAGRVSALVEDPVEDEAFHAVVRVPVLGDADWERVAAAVRAESGHLAALLAGDLPRELVRAAAAAGVDLLPGVGDLESECGCPEWGDPCRHTAALVVQAAWLLDAEPALLLLLRGRDATALAAPIARTAPTGPAEPPERSVPPDPGATDAPQSTTGPPGTPTGRPDVTPPDPAPPPEVPPAWPPAEPLMVPPAPGVDPQALAALAAAAARRARELLGPPG
ncbi:MAG TPA: SWIM zinc finger family protein [Pseudonocardia sp.]|nr:SWIM zinc finger family protein [Pseudonocardia sp.]